MTTKGGKEQGSITNAGGSIYRGSGFEQTLNNMTMSPFGCCTKGNPPVIIPTVGISSFSNEELNHTDVTRSSSSNQRSVTI